MAEAPQPAEQPSRPGKLAAWCQLFRLPNLLTVPGDPIAGYVLAASAAPTEPGVSRPYLRLGLAASISLLMYMAGLLWNDWFDLAKDARERPRRPLPSGAIRPNAVAVTATVLILLAVFVATVAGDATLYVTAALGLAVMAYNRFAKGVPVVGPVVMGLCRGLSVLVGAAALGVAGLTSLSVIAAAGGVLIYIAAVTALAARETQARRLGLLRWLPAGAMLLWVAAINATGLLTGFVPIFWEPTAVVQILALGLALACAERLKGAPATEVVQQTVGRLIRALLLVQASIIAGGGDIGLIIAIALVLAWPVSAILSRRFYAS